MIERGASALVGSRSAAMAPSIVRAVGSHVDAASDRITVYLWAPQAAQVLEDIRNTGHLAVVFSQPSTHRTVQFKARSAEVGPAAAADAEPVDRYLAAMRRELSTIGFPPGVADALLAHRPDELTAVKFRPELAFDQSPGPRAGQPL